MTNKLKNVLVTGGSGMLGSFVVRSLLHDPAYKVYTVSRAGINVAGTHHASLDITDGALLNRFLTEVQPEIIVHCAAMVDVNACETEREYAYALHVKSTEWLCQFPTVNRFIYISTDSVFDGQRGNYTETDAVNPLNYYAQTKLEGEVSVQRFAKHYTILRTNILGFHTPVKKSLFEWAYTSLCTKTVINGFENVYFNPLYCGDLSALVGKLLKTESESGVYHVGSSNPVSKYTFLKRVAEFFEFGEDLVKPVKLDSSSLGAVRPLNTVLVTDKIERKGFNMPDMEQTIHQLCVDFSKQMKHEKRI